METHVNADGTCSRLISFKTDSVTLVSGTNLTEEGNRHERGVCTAALIADDVWTDDAWEKSWTDSERSGQHPVPMAPEEYQRLHDEAMAHHQQMDDAIRFCLRRDFCSVEAMSAAMPVTIMGMPLEAQASLQKKFRWFYTEYTFTETIRSIGDRYPVAYSNYLTDEEIQCWFTYNATSYEGRSGQENLQMLESIEEKAEQWYSALYYHMALDAIAHHYDEVKDAPLSLEHFCQLQDSLTSDAVSLGFNIGKLSTKAGDYKLLANFLTHQLHTDVYETALEQSPVLTEALDHVGESLLEVLVLNIQYHATLIDEAQDFEIKGLELIARDYTASITTRHENLWAYIVTLLICCIAAGSFFIKRKS